MNSNTNAFQSQPDHPRQTFFDSLRNSGYQRAEPRVVGGVLSGLSVKYGWDTTLLRIVAVVASLFFPLTAAAYALAWFFLPEQRDGRIHAEALTLGYFDIAQFGALIMFLIGLGNSGLYVIGLGSFFWPLLLIGVGLFVYFIIESNKRTPRVAAQAPGGTAPFNAAPFAGTTAGTSTPFGAPSATTPGEAPAASFTQSPHSGGDWRTQGGPTDSGTPFAYSAPSNATSAPAPQAPPAAPSYYVPRPVQRPRTLPTSVNLLVTGLVVLVFAFVSAFMFIPELQLTTGQSGTLLLASGGICLLLVAIPMVIAALRDRSAAWLVALSICGIMLAGPVSVAATAMRYDSHLNHFPNAIEMKRWHDNDPEQLSSADTEIGTVRVAEWNLADLPDGDTTTYNAEDVLGTLTIFVRKDQPIELNVADTVGVIDAEYLPSSTNHWVKEHLGISNDVSMRSVTNPRTPITQVNIASVLGTLKIVEVEDPRPAKDHPQSAVDSTQSVARADKPQSATTALTETAQSAQYR